MDKRNEELAKNDQRSSTQTLTSVYGLLSARELNEIYSNHRSRHSFEKLQSDLATPFGTQENAGSLNEASVVNIG